MSGEQDQPPVHLDSLDVPNRALEPLVGTLLAGQYRLEELIGHGGMGQVYRARQLKLDRDVAVKVVTAERLKNDGAFGQRFLREAAAAARTVHPNVVVIHDFGEDKGRLWLAMEYLNGPTLHQLIHRQGPLSARRTVHVGLQVARAMAAVHHCGIAHRDLKPGNVMLVDQGGGTDTVKLLDFGLAKAVELDSDITEANTILGSPRYAAPEQLTPGGQVDRRCDIYSFGILLYTMLAGRPPFMGNFLQVAHAHLKFAARPINEFNPKAEVPALLDSMIRHCLRKKPDSRYQTMDEIVRELERFLKDAGSATDWLVLDGEQPQAEEGLLDERLVLDVDTGELESIRPEQESLANRSSEQTAVTNDTNTNLSVDRGAIPPWAWAAAVGAMVAAIYLMRPAVEVPSPTTQPAPSAMAVQNPALQTGGIQMEPAEAESSSALPASAEQRGSNGREPSIEQPLPSEGTPAAATRPQRSSPSAGQGTPANRRLDGTMRDVSITSVPAGATVWWGDRDLGMTPLRRPLQLPAGGGAPTFQLTLEGFAPVNVRASVGTEGELTAHHVMRALEVETPEGYKDSPY